MRIALAFILLLCRSRLCQAPQVTRTDVTEFGIYTADLVKRKRRREPCRDQNIVTHMRLAHRREQSPRKGRRIRLSLHLVGAPAGAIAPLHAVTIFPSAMTDPATRIENQIESDFG